MNGFLPLVRETRVTAGGRTLTWAQLSQAAAEKFDEKPWLRRPLALLVSSQREALEVIPFIAEQSCDFLLASVQHLDPSPLQETLSREGFGFLRYATGDYTLPPPAGHLNFRPGRISLLTSGSTGTPKRIEHNWQTLQTVPPDPTRLRQTWLLPFDIGTYAWYQLVTLSLFVPGNDLVAVDSLEPETWIEIMGNSGVTALSSTPTLWRLLLLRIPRHTLRDLPLRQITLGGERVDQPLLDTLRALYPEARLTHIYASSEAGACIVVNDRREGFPVAYLDNPSRKVRLRIRNDELQILSPYSNTRDEGCWIASGDRVRIRGDRVLFEGRTGTPIINVGGNKIHPSEIEAVLMRHPAVAWCRVVGLPSALVGMLPKAEIALYPSATVDEGALVQHCRQHLPEYAIPRWVEFVGTVPLGSNLKAQAA